MIVLNDLTREQVEMCNLLWALDDNEEVAVFLDHLDSRFQSMAKTLMIMMVHEALEEQLKSMTDYPAAEAVISKVKNG